MRRVRHTRICHYPLTLKELTKYLPAEADPGKWKETILRLESTATAINLSKAEAKDIEKLFDIEKKLDGLEVRQQSRVLWVEFTVWPTSPSHSLAKCYTTQTQIALAGRKLVLEGPLKIKKKQVKDGHVYLFKYGLGLGLMFTHRPIAQVQLPLNGLFVAYVSDALVLSKTAGPKASFAGFAALNKCVVRILEDFDSTPPPF